jgi:hypothetical protein
MASTAKYGPPAGRGRAADANADDSGEGSEDDIEDVDDEDSGDGSSGGGKCKGKGKGKGKNQGSTGKKKKPAGKPRGAEVVAPDGFDYGAANDQLTALATAFNALVDFTKQGTPTHYCVLMWVALVLCLFLFLSCALCQWLWSARRCWPWR